MRFKSFVCGLALLSIPVLAECPSADLTGDCFVDLADFAVIAEQWLNSQTDLGPLIDQWLTGDRLPEDMIVIPAGSFQMGNSKNASEGWSIELPVHIVIVDSFAIGKFEITNGQFCDFLKSSYPNQLKVVDGIVYAAVDTGNSFPYFDTSSSILSQIDFSNATFSVRSKGDKDMTHHPLVCVSWYGAVAFCNWRSQQEGKENCYNLTTWVCDFSKHGYRLPTEAEWECAARGGVSGNRFPWGDTINHNNANYRANSIFYFYDSSPYTIDTNHPAWNDGIWPFTALIGSFPPNPYGVYDMAGNVIEWCHDWFGSYSSSSQTNPTGPEIGAYRVARDGGWDGYAKYCRVSRRDRGVPSTQNAIIGFRIALGLK